MDNTTTIALSRLMVQERALDVSADNMANSDTPGYKGERVQFSDWLSRQTGMEAVRGEHTLAYVQDRATYRDQQDGAISHTANPLDLAIAGDGFFTVGTTRGPRLTRAGRFMLQPDGTISDNEGNALLNTAGAKIQVSPNDTQITVAADGTISSENGQIGKIGIVKPDDFAKMTAEGGRQFRADTDTSPIATPKVVQGAVESSNVVPILEMTRMLDAQREFQFVTQFIQGVSDLENNSATKILQRSA